MSKFERVSKELTAYVRAYIRAQYANGLSYKKIGDLLDCTHSWIKQLDADKSGDKRIGQATEFAMAERYHGGSIDGFRHAAHAFAAGGAIYLTDSETGESLHVKLGASPSEVDAKVKRRSRAR